MTSKSATSAVAITLYRAMWRWTRSETVRLAKFAVPLESMPSEVLAVAERLQPTEVMHTSQVDNSQGKMAGVLRDQAGVQALVREAWREGANVSEAEAGTRLDGAFKCLRAMDEANVENDQIAQSRAQHFLVKAGITAVRRLRKSDNLGWVHQSSLSDL